MFLSALGLELMCFFSASTGQRHRGLFAHDGCSVLSHSSSFITSLRSTVFAFLIGIRILYKLPSLPNSSVIIKNALIILITAESCCIITAEIVDMIFYRSAVLFSIPLGIAGGAASIMLIEIIRNQGKNK
jgi:hypothetical protein